MKISNLVLIALLLLSTTLLAQRDRRMQDRDDRGRMEMYAIWKLTDDLGLEEKQAEVFFPKLRSHKEELSKLQEKEKEIWKDLVIKAKKGEEVSDKELKSAMDKSKALGKKRNAEKEKFKNGLKGTLTNEQQVKFMIFGREMVSDAKERMRDHRERGRDKGGYKKKRKRW